MVDMDILVEEAARALKRWDRDADIKQFREDFLAGTWTEDTATAMCRLTGTVLSPGTQGLFLFNDPTFPDQYGPWTEQLIAVWEGLA
jgi:hypothetical protein